MSPWIWLLDGVGVLLILVLLVGAALIVRRRFLSRDGGTFELSWRARHGASGRGWLLGMGRYTGDELEWFRIFSLAPRPKRRWHRKDLAFAGKRDPEGVEAISLYADHLVVTMDGPDGLEEFAMSSSSLTGLQSWLEAGLPQPPRA